jgi:CheY-like chemotaxis protein
VTGAGSALNALQEEVFDAVLLDLHMQDLDGLEALRRIRDLPRPLGSELPVFLTTADTEQSSLQACLEAGVQGVLPKPLRKAWLAALLSGVSQARPAPSPTGAPLVDATHVARIVADLGPEAWQKGLRACRTSAGVCLQDLEDPDRVGRALHRLAGLSACYGMPRLHELVRRAEAMVASGAPCPQAELGALMSASLVQLEAAAP